MEIPIKMDDLGVPLFSDTPIFNFSLFLADGCHRFSNPRKIAKFLEVVPDRSAEQGTSKLDVPSKSKTLEQSPIKTDWFIGILMIMASYNPYIYMGSKIPYSKYPGFCLLLT